MNGDICEQREREKACIHAGRRGSLGQTTLKTHNTSQWNRGTMMTGNLENNISVDGIPHHVFDVHRIVTLSANENGEEEVSGTPFLQRSQ